MAGSRALKRGKRHAGWLASLLVAMVLPQMINAASPQAPETSLRPQARPGMAQSHASTPELSEITISKPRVRPELSGLSHLAGAGVSFDSRWRGVAVKVPMTRAVPWRVFSLEEPNRLVIDFSELDWQGLDVQSLLASGDWFTDIRAGLYRPGWTRMVLSLAVPMTVTSAGMKTKLKAGSSDGSTGRAATAQLTLDLSLSTQEEFAATAGPPANAVFDTPIRPMPSPKTRQRGVGDAVVVLDPGHGGIDPGAERGGVVEADLMLQFARELQEELLRAGGFQVVLTRDDDVFVPLEERVTIARRAGADIFLSLHADAIAQGRATGATVYTLSQDASDIASRKLAERHDRGDLLAGVDLSHQDDEVALVLMDLARTETAPRSESLADALVEGIYAATGSAYKTPRLQAGFSVLKAPDIPSALIELGFLSSARDRKSLTSGEWRADAARGIREALQYWVLHDASKADLLRQ